MDLLNADQYLAIQEEIHRLKLPDDFISVINDYYLPLAMQLSARTGRSQSTRPLLIGMQGAPGSGKSTCAAFIKQIFEICFTQNTLVISIDDFYLTRAERQTLAKTVHPLFVTRGVPGTHDIGLLQAILDACYQTEHDVFSVPVFDKAKDDRADSANWQQITEKLDIVILEGWCVGLKSQNEVELQLPINELEAQEDSNGLWRGYVNQQLSHEYASLFDQLDYLIALQAPSFECVYEWRLLQEQKLMQKLAVLGEISNDTKIMSTTELTRFISHYERLTRHALATIPKQADWLLMLKQRHGFSQLIAN